MTQEATYFKNKRGLNIYYEVLNKDSKKDVIVFLNGVMASVSSWKFQYDLLEKMGYKIIVQDFVGQLKSDKFEGLYSFYKHAEDTIDLLDHLGIKEAHFIGTSYGGEVAMKLASQFSSHVKSISVIDSVSELDQNLIDGVSAWIDLAETKNGQVFFNGMMPSIYGQPFIDQNKEMLESRAKAMNHVPDSYFEGQIALYHTFLQDVTMTQELKDITCPTLIVCGELDTLKPMKFSKLIHDEIKDSLYITIPDCGHVTIFEKPQELNTILLGFLQQLQ
jgi:3-oxoadipate enol-lactonase